ncbi:MAG: electron transfer flavoprotein subunit beta [Candidatus Omnitrophica bacterium CG23_combo_of_CG06-09_8_20_14_all_40_11]|nr:MAG: electron transfer flavoprotein subunit beta [Candidatus Omnitrophica bacterium CG23_combo_of_CG06-09_8_20_14_all_40_11]
MNIIVCIKQVPETTEVKINPETNTLIREGVKSIINPFDAYAIEEGVRLKEKFGAKATVITMGPPQAEAVLREAISLGIDDGILLSDRAFAGSDTWATSYALSAAIKKIGAFDLIVCGKQASDGDTAQVGPGISAHLDIPAVTYVKKIEEINPVRNTKAIIGEDKISNGVKDNFARVERMTEAGYEIIEVSLPALITVVKEINTPRLPSLKGMMRAKQAKIIHWKASDIEVELNFVGLAGSPTQVVKIFTPAPRVGGQMLKGETQEIVDRLVGLLKSDIP